MKMPTPTSLVLVTTVMCQQTWSGEPLELSLTDAPALHWISLASSADGTVAIGADSQPLDLGQWTSGNIHVSTNTGQTWIQTSAPSNPWSSLAVSAAADHIVATAGLGLQKSDGSPFGGGIYTSADRGRTWTRTAAPQRQWTSVASSADGMRLAAVASSFDSALMDFRSGIFTSDDAGATWVPRVAPTNDWVAATSSGDGANLIVAGIDPQNGVGGIYLSSDSGATWRLSGAPLVSWVSLSCSADGINAVAASLHGLYTSTNAGVTWSGNEDAQSKWLSVACSGYGNWMIAVVGGTGTGGLLGHGQDWGDYWEGLTDLVTIPGRVAMSADGTTVFVSGRLDNLLYRTLSTPAPPNLAITCTSGKVLLSWPVPSAQFVLQERPNLQATNWLDVSALPTLNPATLRYEVPVPLMNRQAFFRLEQN